MSNNGGHVDTYKRGSVTLFREGGHYAGYTIHPLFFRVKTGTLAVMPEESLQELYLEKKIRENGEMPKKLRFRNPSQIPQAAPHDLFEILNHQMGIFQSMAYRSILHLKLIDDLLGADFQKASREILSAYAASFTLTGKHAFALYFIGDVGEDGVYSTPAAIVTARGFSPAGLSHDLILYLNGQPIMAASRGNGENIRTLDDNQITSLVASLNQVVGGGVRNLSINVVGNEERGVIIPSRSIGISPLESIVAPH